MQKSKLVTPLYCSSIKLDILVALFELLDRKKLPRKALHQRGAFKCVKLLNYVQSNQVTRMNGFRLNIYLF